MLEEGMATVSTSNTLRWWGEISLDLEQNQVWDFGSLLICLQRLSHEWQVRYKHFHIKPDEEKKEVLTWFGDGGLTDSELTDKDQFRRFVFSKTLRNLVIVPVLPERNIVAKPINSISLMPEEQITLYVSVALWLRIVVKESGQMLCELPIRELSDTWFGPTPREGVLCFASKTHALVNKESLSLRPYRAIVPVTIDNRHNDILNIEKINIPVPLLEVRRSDSGLLWASEVNFTKIRNSNDIKLSTNTNGSANKAFKQWELIAEARKTLEEKFITKAFEVFFS